MHFPFTALESWVFLHFISALCLVSSCGNTSEQSKPQVTVSVAVATNLKCSWIWQCEQIPHSLPIWGQTLGQTYSWSHEIVKKCFSEFVCANILTGLDGQCWMQKLWVVCPLFCSDLCHIHLQSKRMSNLKCSLRFCSSRKVLSGSQYS